MDYVKPADVAKAMAETGLRKLALPPRDLMIRGVLSGGILGVATSLAFTAAVSTGQPLVGALIFPVGLIFIVLLGLELITGSFALLPLPWLDGGAKAPTGAAVLTNWGWVFVANLILSYWKGTKVGKDPWDAWTLEWSVSSPPPAYNFASIPGVASRRPLWDLKHPEDPDSRYE